MRPIATIDTSSLIALDLLDLIPLTANLFSRILLPKFVRHELFRRRRTKDRLQRMLNEYGFIERCDDYDRSVVEFLVAGRRNRDRGEAETVVQATPLNATVIVDDLWGRELAASYRLEPYGTVWMLRRLHELGFIDAPGVRNHFVSLRRNRIRLPLAAVNELLADVGQLPMPVGSPS